MRHAVWGLGTMLLLALNPPAFADKKESQGNWFTRIFAGKAAKEEPKKDARARPKEPQAAKQSSKALLATYMRRVEVCDKLKGVALQTGDDALLRRAEQLEIRVWDSYQDQLKGLAQNRRAVSPEEQTLDEHLGIESGARTRTSMPADAIRTVPGSGLAGRR